jgi:hypothetical protein
VSDQEVGQKQVVTGIEHPDGNANRCDTRRLNLMPESVVHIVFSMTV